MNAVMRTITVGTVTYAQKARRALAAQGIGARLVRVSSEREGCVYGVEIGEARYFDAIAVLDRLGLYKREL